MYVIVVNFKLHEPHIDSFREAIIENARASVENEAGCCQFDVCWDPEDKRSVFLYEVYKDKAAFDAHLASEHFESFNAKTAPWIAEKNVNAYQRAFPAKQRP